MLLTHTEDKTETNKGIRPILIQNNYLINYLLFQQIIEYWDKKKSFVVFFCLSTQKLVHIFNVSV